MRDRTGGGLDPEFRAEVIVVAVARHKCGPRVVVVEVNGKLGLESGVALAGREKAPAAAEERIVGRHRFWLQAKAFQQSHAAPHPHVAMRGRAVGAAEIDILVHPERLHARGIDRWFVPEAVAVDVYDGAGRRQRAGVQRIDGVACGGREHEVRRQQRRFPLLACFCAGKQRGVICVRARE